MAKKHSTEFDNFSLVRGGALFHALVRLRLMTPDLDPVYLRAAILALFAWLPLLLLSALQGSALVETVVKVPLLGDLATFTRFLVSLPLLIIAERVVDSRSCDVLIHLNDSGLISNADEAKFKVIIHKVEAMVNSVTAELVILAIVVVSGAYINLEFSGVTSTWQFISFPGGEVRSAAGWWHLLVSLPIYQFLVLRWLWRYAAWCRLHWSVSRLDLQLNPSHPDRVGGLAFLGIFQGKFCVVIIALSSVFSAYIAQEILLAGATLPQFTLMITGYVLLILVMFVGPLFVYSVKLYALQRRGFLDYSALAHEYTQTFDRKWIKGEAPKDEALVGSSDIQSLADLANSFTVVREMSFVPFDFRLTIIPLAAAALIPFVPLALTVFPLEEIIKKIIGIVL